MSLHGLESRYLGFCALGYNRRPGPDALSLEDVIIILVERENKEIEVLIRPQWRSLVDPDDREYIEELQADLEVRAGLESESLMRQTSMLSSGPLITFAAGRQLRAHPELLQLIQGFRKA